MSQSQKPLGGYQMRHLKFHFCVFIFGFFAFLILEFLKLIMLWATSALVFFETEEKCFILYFSLLTGRSVAYTSD